jgi:hypothetical protein
LLKKRVMTPKSISFEARRRFELWADRYDQLYGSDNSPLTYTLRAELPVELDPDLDLVVVEVDVMQHEFFGASGWQRALFLDKDGEPSDVDTCDLQLDAEGCTLHRYANGDLLRITAAGIVSDAIGQMMLAPMLKRFDRRGKRLWASKRVSGAVTNRARDEELFDLDRPLPSKPVWGISARGNSLVLETDGEVAVIDARTGKRTRMTPPPLLVCVEQPTGT